MLGGMKMIEKLVKALADRDLTQRAFEAQCGLSENRISKWKDGTGEPTARQALAMARALGLPLEFLVDDSIDEPEAPTASPGLTVEEYAVLSHFRVQREKEREAGGDLTPDDLAFRIAVRRLKNAGQTLIGTAGDAASGNNSGSSNPRKEPTETR